MEFKKILLYLISLAGCNSINDKNLMEDYYKNSKKIKLDDFRHSLYNSTHSATYDKPSYNYGDADDAKRYEARVAVAQAASKLFKKPSDPADVSNLHAARAELKKLK
ncbi:hypothetical protein ACRRVD_02180 [Candidatus Cardinium hertigii]|uniref:hypothetical protein n=1 Tax=Candidatus Cardinium hertigii TaxID=247481 RepID=UPI003D7D39CB